MQPAALRGHGRPPQTEIARRVDCSAGADHGDWNEENTGERIESEREGADRHRPGDRQELPHSMQRARSRRRRGSNSPITVAGTERAVATREPPAEQPHQRRPRRARMRRLPVARSSRRRLGLEGAHPFEETLGEARAATRSSLSAAILQQEGELRQDTQVHGDSRTDDGEERVHWLVVDGTEVHRNLAENRD